MSTTLIISNDDGIESFVYTRVSDKQLEDCKVTIADLKSNYPLIVWLSEYMHDDEDYHPELIEQFQLQDKNDILSNMRCVTKYNMEELDCSNVNTEKDESDNISKLVLLDPNEYRHSIPDKEKSRLAELQDSKEKYTLIVYHPNLTTVDTMFYLLPAKKMTKQESNIILEQDTENISNIINGYYDAEEADDGDDIKDGESHPDIDWTPYKYKYNDLLAFMVTKTLYICIKRVIAVFE